jgi:predicted methyltransferase
MTNVWRSAGLVAWILALVACGDRPAGDLDIYGQAVANKDRSWADQRRDKLRKPDEILRFSGLQPGMTAVDLLGGGGYYAELMSYVAGPSGRVILQNNTLFLKFSVEEMGKRLRGNRLPNIERLDSQFSDFELPSDVDLIFLGLSYHDIYIERSDPVKTTNREEFFPQVWNALKPGGRVLVIDHAAKPGTGIETTEALHRIAEDFAVADWQEAGFTYLGSLDVLRNPADDHSLRMREDAIRGRTDRFVLLFEKPLVDDSLE